MITMSNSSRSRNCSCAIASRTSISPAESVARARSRRSRSSNDGGQTKTSVVSGTAAADGERAFDLELEDHALPGRQQAVDFGLERAVATTRVGDVLEELAGIDAALELLVA